MYMYVYVFTPPIHYNRIVAHMESKEFSLDEELSVNVFSYFRQMMGKPPEFMDKVMNYMYMYMHINGNFKRHVHVCGLYMYNTLYMTIAYMYILYVQLYLYLLQVKLMMFLKVITILLFCLIKGLLAVSTCTCTCIISTCTCITSTCTCSYFANTTLKLLNYTFIICRDWISGGIC